MLETPARFYATILAFFVLAELHTPCAGMLNGSAYVSRYNQSIVTVEGIKTSGGVITCTGVVVSNTYVLAPAHCTLLGIGLSSVTVKPICVDGSSAPCGKIVVKSRVRHPCFKLTDYLDMGLDFDYKDDLALLELTTPLGLEPEDIFGISSSFMDPGAAVTVLGYKNPRASPVYTDVTTTGGDECLMSAGGMGANYYGMFCFPNVGDPAKLFMPRGYRGDTGEVVVGRGSEDDVNATISGMVIKISEKDNYGIALSLDLYAAWIQSIIVSPKKDWICNKCPCYGNGDAVRTSMATRTGKSSLVLTVCTMMVVLVGAVAGRQL
jgi:hypothetical protein